MAVVEFLSVREYSELKTISKETVRLMLTKNEKLADGWEYKKVDSTWIIYRFN